MANPAQRTAVSGWRPRRLARTGAGRTPASATRAAFRASLASMPWDRRFELRPVCEVGRLGKSQGSPRLVRVRAARVHGPGCDPQRQPGVAPEHHVDQDQLSST
ncbi:hypothetical protein GCM10010207_52130 [Streptomyces atratus]|nr:hypothetical protein GCM10010207_52130 [Streptomyces atratus]